MTHTNASNGKGSGRPDTSWMQAAARQQAAEAEEKKRRDNP